VIGASAGGVETLRRVVAGLPADLPAAVCIVLHVAPSSPSALAKILDRAGSLPCRTARDGDWLKPGEILVAPPDRHLVVHDGRIRLTAGPRENGHRPAVDVLFRSAAAARGSRVVGIVLSGTRDDGSVGLAAIKAHGGATIVQDPEEALYPGMPASALANVVVDAVVPSTLVAETVAAMVAGEHPPPRTATRPLAGADSPSSERMTTICPECGGVLREREEAGVTHWECRVGHRYSPESLVNAQAETVESALWAAVRGLEDHGALLHRTATRMESSGEAVSARAMFGRASEISEQAKAVREALGDLRPAESVTRADPAPVAPAAAVDTEPANAAPADTEPVATVDVDAGASAS
jgi:two-component system chemotaxis response regulator CheB